VELRDRDLVPCPIAAGDEEALIAGLHDAAVTRFMTLIPRPYTRDDADGWIERSQRVRADGSSQPFANADAASGDLIGGIEVSPRANAASWRVAEKAGFRRVGVLPQDPPFPDGTAEADLFERP
jgi:RimJ/RimL family protein N-acetyltransferase